MLFRSQLFLLLFSAQVLAQKPQVIIPKGHTAAVSDALIFGDNRYVLSGGRDNTMIVWDIASQKEIAAFAGEQGRGAYSFVGISPNKQWLIRAGSKEFSIWNAQTKDLYASVGLEDGFGKDIVLSPDNQKVYFRADAGSKWHLMLFDIPSKKLSKIKTFEAAKYQQVRYDKNANFLIYAPFGKTNKIVRVELATGKSENLLTFGEDIEGFGLLNGQGIVWNYAGNATIFDTQTGNIIRQLSLGKHENMILSPDGRTMASRESFKGNTVSFYDVATQKQISNPKLGHEVSAEAENILSYRFSDDGKYVVSTGEDKQVLVWSATTGEIIFSSKSSTNLGLPRSTQFQQQNFFVNTQGDRLTAWDLQRGTPNLQLSDFSSTEFQYCFDTDPNRILAPDKSGKLAIFDTKTGLKKQQFPLSVQAAAWLSADKILAISYQQEIFTYPIISANQTDSPHIIAKEKYTFDYAISPRKDKLAIENPDQKNINIYNLANNSTQSISTSEGFLESFTFSPDSKQLAVSYTHKTKKEFVFLKTYDTNTGKEIRQADIKIKDFSYAPLAISPDSKYFLTIGGENNAEIMVYDFATMRAIHSLKGHTNKITSLQFSENSKLLASTSNDYSTKLWNVETGKEIATLYSFPKTNDWVVISPDGRFDASVDAQKMMYFSQGLKILPLSSLFEQFYTPNLLARLLKGEKLSPPEVNINTLKTAPNVKIIFQEGQRNLLVADEIPTYDSKQAEVVLELQAEADDDVVQEIRLFHNNKLVANPRSNQTRFQTKIKITLAAGTNHFKAVALNSQRTESQPDEILLNYQPALPVNKTNDIALYLLVVGINKYKNPKYNLNYALADANGFKQSIQENTNGIFSKINTFFLSDENATKQSISAELDKIKAMANAKDVLIFYYAGHGVLNDKEAFYLVPHDVTQLYGSNEALAQKGLSTTLLQQYSKDIAAQKQLFILDACQSAGALQDVVAFRGAAEEKAIAQLARSTGTHWLTASGTKQFASEFEQLGHGVFTYVLLEALKGKADIGGDRKISVKELDAYLQEKVPEISEKYKGTPQYPTSYGYGNDFPIGILK